MKNRATSLLNLRQYNNVNLVKDCGLVNVTAPVDQYVLRMLVKKPNTDFRITPKLEWTIPLFFAALKSQEEIEIRQPFVYITVRSGEVTSITDDEWHVDGFSTRVSHIPEQNYSWVDHTGSEYIEEAIEIPEDFNPRKHNIHWFFQDWIKVNNVTVKRVTPKHLTGMDPYIVHRRPQIVGSRTFVRISFTPIEIEDVNNTPNPLLKTSYTRDGVKDFRNSLTRYHFPQGSVKHGDSWHLR